MSGMVHTAKRLLPYAKNKVVHIEAVTDPVLLRLLRNERTLALLREGLKAIDPQYEILVPYHVDSEEAQLKRYIQWKFGTRVNLSMLRREHFKYYLRLYEYGSPVEVIKEWGLMPVYDHIYKEDTLLEEIESYKDEKGVVSGVSKNERLYKSLKYFAKKAGKSVKDYLESKGFKYRGRGGK